MIEKDVLKALNTQVNAELLSGYMYVSAASFLDDENYSGMAAWLFNHGHEEYSHAMRIRNFISDKDERVVFYALDNPDAGWKNPADVWQKIYEHELEVTDMILDIVRLAREKGDITTEIFLNWFVKEQVEEEQVTRDIRDRVVMIGDDVGALLTYDRWLADKVEKGIEDTAKLAAE